MEKFQIYFFTFIFLAVILLSFSIFLPFLVPVSIAAVLAFLFSPLHERTASTLGGRRGLAALATVTFAVFVIVIPFVFIGKAVFQEATGFSAQLQNGTGNVAGFLSSIEKAVSYYFPGFSLNLNEYIRLGTDWLVQNIGGVFAGIARVTVGLLINLFIGVIAFYYLLKDGRKFVRELVSLSPLPDKYDYEIISRLESTVSSVVKGSLIVALVQGFSSFVGFIIFGVPNPALLGSTAAVAALIPGVGTSLVLVPAIIYLFAVGSGGAGFGLLVWGVIAVGLIDNMLGPMLIKRGVRIHPFFILLSVIGGLWFFGPIGFLLGPLVLSLLFGMIEIYRFLVNSEQKSSRSIFGTIDEI